MSFLKLNSAKVLFAALAMLVAGSQTALAKTIFLTCETQGTFSVDLTNSTVNNVYKANITATNISFVMTTPPLNGMTADATESIDRTTGIDTYSVVFHRADGTDANPLPQYLHCTESNTAPATKF